MKRDFNEFKMFIKNKKVAVVGIGVSNIPLIRFLLELGAKVSAFDRKSEEDLAEVGVEFKKKGVQLVLGENYLEQLIGYEVVFKTPSMRIDSEALVKAKDGGAYITSEMEEFVRYCPAKVFGITGSDGKTTTTTLVCNILKEEGYKTWIGGNIGMPLFSRIEEISKEDKVVLELSSFQLMTMTVSPEVAVITNLSPNHLDIHKDMEEYIEAKKNIFKYQDVNDLLILNKDNAITNCMVKEAKGKTTFFSTRELVEEGSYFKEGILYAYGKRICSKDEIIIKGMHNVENYLAAFSAVGKEVSVESMRKTATTFTGVEHRGEFVKEIDGVKYYNDSIATSPTRTLASIRAFEQSVILIAGGYDKKLPFTKLAEEGLSMVKALVLVGVTKNKIKEAFETVMIEKEISIPIFIVEDFKEAVIKAKEISRKGDIVTMSPACASFDMFVNFEVRGNVFKEIVNTI